MTLITACGFSACFSTAVDMWAERARETEKTWERKERLGLHVPFQPTYRCFVTAETFKLIDHPYAAFRLLQAHLRGAVRGEKGSCSGSQSAFLALL